MTEKCERPEKKEKKDSNQGFNDFEFKLKDTEFKSNNKVKYHDIYKFYIKSGHFEKIFYIEPGNTQVKYSYAFWVCTYSNGGQKNWLDRFELHSDEGQEWFNTLNGAEKEYVQWIYYCIVGLWIRRICQLPDCLEFKRNWHYHQAPHGPNNFLGVLEHHKLNYCDYIKIVDPEGYYYNQVCNPEAPNP